MHLYYPSTHPLSKPYPLLVTLSACMISPGSRQIRYHIKGNKGQYIKYGLDTQEATLRKMDWTKGKADEISPVGKEGWGAEEKGSEAEIETLVDGKWQTKKCVQQLLNNDGAPEADLRSGIGTPPPLAVTNPSTNPCMKLFGQERARRLFWSSQVKLHW